MHPSCARMSDSVPESLGFLRCNSHLWLSA